MPLEPPDQQHWQAAVGYVELGMFAEADSELDKIDPFCRALPEVLAVRLPIYRGLKKWELMQQIAKRLKEFEPDNVRWTNLTRLRDAAGIFHRHSDGNSALRTGEVSERGSNPIQSRVLLLPTWRNRNGKTLFKESFCN